VDADQILAFRLGRSGLATRGPGDLADAAACPASDFARNSALLAVAARVPCPPTAQHALHQGNLCGRNLAAVAAGGDPEPFRYTTLGLFVNLGSRQAVAASRACASPAGPRGS